MTNGQKSDIKKVNEKTIDAYSDFGGLIKHAARCLLWLPEARALRQEENRCLKYFTLPGRWAWDIFFLEKEGVIQKDSRGFPEVRFCDNNSKSYSDAKRLLGNTIGKKENFERLVLNEQVEFWDSFPYDIYNLDFCGTCFPDNQPPFSETFQAIEKIIEKHVEGNHFPFVIFLTMKAFDGETNPHAKEQLIQNIKTNRANAGLTQQIATVIPNIQHFVAQNFTDFIVISVPKIICHLAKRHCDLDVRSRAKYLRSNDAIGDFFITKFVFKFTRRRQSHLAVMNQNYINNILNIMRLDNVVTIDNNSITQDIRRSSDELKQYIQQISLNPLESQ